MTDTRFCWTQGVWLTDCDDCACAAQDRADDAREHMDREDRA